MRCCTGLRSCASSTNRCRNRQRRASAKSSSRPASASTSSSTSSKSMTPRLRLISRVVLEDAGDPVDTTLRAVGPPVGRRRRSGPARSRAPSPTRSRRSRLRAPASRPTKPNSFWASRSSRRRSPDTVFGASVRVVPPLAQHTQHDGVERAGLDMVAQPEAEESASELAGRFAGERECQRVSGVGVARRDPMGDPPGQDAGLAGAGAGDDGDEVRAGGDGRALVRIEVGDQRVGIHDRHPRRHRRSQYRETMPYPKRLLNRHEEVAVDLHPHWWYYVEAGAGLVGGIALGHRDAHVDRRRRRRRGRC